MKIENEELTRGFAHSPAASVAGEDLVAGVVAQTLCKKIEGETIQSLDALGTAYAAVGNYKMGAERLERALAMAKAEKAEELIGPLTMRMNFFKKGRVYSDETIGSDR